jgi:glycosyltransferase involved in cell wall biosynthesis
MKVSVIIPTYKRSDYLIRAIDSVLNQNYPYIEIIVVDDNGTGRQQEITKSIINKYDAVILITYNENKGACHARNIGAKKASGDVIMFLDDDDYYLPEKVVVQCKILESNKIDACLCAMKRIDDDKNIIISEENFPRGEDLKTYILNGNCFTSMIAIKRHVFNKIGGFSEISRFQDKFFMYKFYKNNLKAKLINEQLFVLMEHKGERISLGNSSKISKALTILLQFEKNYFHILNKEEQAFVKKRFNRAMAEIRTNGSFKTRLKGLYFLVKSNLFLFKIKGSNLKLFVRLLMSESSFNKLKNTFH